MKVGGKRRLVMPPELGYGEKGFAPKVPPNATLIFDIELVNVENPPAPVPPAPPTTQPAKPKKAPPPATQPATDP